MDKQTNNTIDHTSEVEVPIKASMSQDKKKRRTVLLASIIIVLLMVVGLTVYLVTIFAPNSKVAASCLTREDYRELTGESYNVANFNPHEYFFSSSYMFSGETNKLESDNLSDIGEEAAAIAKLFKNSKKEALIQLHTVALDFESNSDAKEQLAQERLNIIRKKLESAGVPSAMIKDSIIADDTKDNDDPDALPGDIMVTLSVKSTSTADCRS